MTDAICVSAIKFMLNLAGATTFTSNFEIATGSMFDF
jgi:hypothetical protein